MKLNLKRPSVIIFCALMLALYMTSCGEKKSNGNTPSAAQEKASPVAEEMVVIEDYIADSDTGTVVEDSVSVQLDIKEDNAIAALKNVDQNDILRVEGTASISWKGVSGCCEQSTANKQAKKAIEAWVGKQILANRPHTYYRSGIVGDINKAKCSSKTSWDGKRSCKGKWSQPYYIEFIKQQ